MSDFLLSMLAGVAVMFAWRDFQGVALASDGVEYVWDQTGNDGEANRGDSKADREHGCSYPEAKGGGSADKEREKEGDKGGEKDLHAAAARSLRLPWSFMGRHHAKDRYMSPYSPGFH